MTRLVVLCLAGWLVAVVDAQPPEPAKPAPLTQEQQNRLKERDRLQKEAEKLTAEGKLTEAIAAAQKMLAIEQEVLGNFHPDAVGSLQFLAELHEAREDFAAARNARREVLAIQTKLRGADHWQVIDARIALEDVERLARMEPADRRRRTEAEHLNRLVIQLYQQGKTREAIALAQKALEIRKEVQGERHPAYAQSLNNLAALYYLQGAYPQAERLYRQALDIRKQVQGDRHPEYATSMNNLAELYKTQGEYTKAEPLYRQALQIRKQALGERPPRLCPEPE
jgi:tetratricopeptide (TPR) repeat protein